MNQFIPVLWQLHPLRILSPKDRIFLLLIGRYHALFNEKKHTRYI